MNIPATPRASAFSFFKSVALASVSALVLSGCNAGRVISNPVVSEADNNEVVFLGDSIFALSGEIQDQIEAKSGETYRSYTTSGAQLIGRVIAPSLIEQFEQAVADNPNIKTLIGDGGGNDILIPAIAFDPHNCKVSRSEPELSDTCKAFVDNLYVAGVDWLNAVADSGVEKGYILGYYNLKNGLLVRGYRYDPVLEYGNATIKRACENSTLDCTFIDPRPVMTPADILIDGIHPAESGSIKIADLMYPIIKDSL